MIMIKNKSSENEKDLVLPILNPSGVLDMVEKIIYTVEMSQEAREQNAEFIELQIDQNVFSAMTDLVYWLFCEVQAKEKYGIKKIGDEVEVDILLKEIEYTLMNKSQSVRLMP